jgi:hypothetical protein
MHQKRYGNPTIRNISIHFELPFKKLCIMILPYLWMHIGSFLQIRENHIEGHAQLEDNMAPPIWNIEDVASEQL